MDRIYNQSRKQDSDDDDSSVSVENCSLYTDFILAYD